MTKELINNQKKWTEQDQRRETLDRYFPLNKASHHDVTCYQIKEARLQARLQDDKITHLEKTKELVAYKGSKEKPSSLLFRTNSGLHLEILIKNKNNNEETMSIAGIYFICNTENFLSILGGKYKKEA